MRSCFPCSAGECSNGWMGTKRPGAVLLAALVLAACTTSRQRMPRVAPQTARATPERIQEMVRQAIQLDVAADRAADTLYAPEALVVANARVRFATPRFAGVGYGGRGTITAATGTLAGRLSRGLGGYPWLDL